MGKLLKAWISQYSSFGVVYEVDIFLSELKIRLPETKLKNLKELYPTKEDVIPYTYSDMNNHWQCSMIQPFD